MFVKNNTKIVMKYNIHIKLCIFLKKNKQRIWNHLIFSEIGKITLEGKGDNPEISSSKELLKALLLVKGLIKELNLDFFW